MSYRVGGLAGNCRSRAVPVAETVRSRSLRYSGGGKEFGIARSGFYITAIVRVRDPKSGAQDSQ